MTDEKVPHFTVNGKEYAFPTDLDLGEMCDAEKFFNVEFGSQATSGIRMAAAMLWIAIKREDPTVTVDDIRRLPPDVFANVVEDDARPPENAESSTGSSETSGDDSKNGSAEPGNVLEPTGSPV